MSNNTSTTDQFQKEVEAREQEESHPIPTQNMQPTNLDQTQNQFQTQPIQEEKLKEQETPQLKTTEESSSPFTDANKMPESTVEQTKTADA